MRIKEIGDLLCFLIVTFVSVMREFPQVFFGLWKTRYPYENKGNIILLQINSFLLSLDGHRVP